LGGAGPYRFGPRPRVVRPHNPSPEEKKRKKCGSEAIPASIKESPRAPTTRENKTSERGSGG